MPTGDQIAFGGSDIQLQPATAQTLALALHELVTNSAKYGALSTLSGRLSIKWEIEADVLQMVWEEKDGPLRRETGVARLRNAKRDRRIEIAARRTGRVRLALRRPDLPAVGPADARRRDTTAAQRPKSGDQRQFIELMIHRPHGSRYTASPCSSPRRISIR